MLLDARGNVIRDERLRQADADFRSAMFGPPILYDDKGQQISGWRFTPLAEMLPRRVLETPEDELWGGVGVRWEV